MDEQQPIPRPPAPRPAGVPGTPDDVPGTPDDVPQDAATTGLAEVDAVLASLDGLEGRPVAEHVTVFEQAHERLRRALDAQPD